MMKKKKIGFKIFVIGCAVLVPALFLLNAIQAERYMNVQREVEELERRQAKHVDENKNLITDISRLSSSDEIRKKAEEEYGMHKAQSEEIIRIEMQGFKK